MFSVPMFPPPVLPPPTGKTSDIFNKMDEDAEDVYNEVFGSFEDTSVRPQHPPLPAPQSIPIPPSPVHRLGGMPSITSVIPTKFESPIVTTKNASVKPPSTLLSNPPNLLLPQVSLIPNPTDVVNASTPLIPNQSALLSNTVPLVSAQIPIVSNQIDLTSAAIVPNQIALTSTPPRTFCRPPPPPPPGWFPPPFQSKPPLTPSPVKTSTTPTVSSPRLPISYPSTMDSKK